MANLTNEQISALAQVLTGLVSRPPVAAAPPAPVPVATSPVDNALGGQLLTGKKTPLAIIAYVVLSMLQANGIVGTATGDPYVKTAAQTTTTTAKPAAGQTAATSTTTTTATTAPAGTTAQAEGTKTPTGQILTTLILAFGALGMLGKFDRGINALGAIAKK